MNTKKYKSREEAMAALRLTIAKKREWMARVEREWAEDDVAKGFQKVISFLTNQLITNILESQTLMIRGLLTYPTYSTYLMKSMNK